METLMRMQNSYDIAQAHKREAEIIVARYVSKTHPLSVHPKVHDEQS
jgi:hypothetical protein